MHTQSLWLETAGGRPEFPKLESEISVDVAIVGGGITGLTAAALLQRAGKTVAVIEYARIGGGETGHTTAHLTEILDTRYHVLISKFGRDGAAQAAASSRAAIKQIEQFVREYAIDCGFTRLPGYLYTENHADVAELEREMHALPAVRVAARLVDRAPLPFETKRALEVPNQAQFNPAPYIFALARKVAATRGSFVFEHTRVLDAQDGTPCHVATESGHITATDVIVAANTPVTNLLLLHTKLAAYRTYALAAEFIPGAAPLTAGLFWDTADPYHYIRGATDEKGRDLLVVGGEDHKTGVKSDTTACFENLERYARTRFQLGPVRYRWSGQIIEPADGLPYIGRNSLSEHVYVATGYSGNGITFGTLAGMLLTDQLLGRNNEWSALYDATRFHPLASARNFVAENIDFPAYFFGDRLTHAETNSIAGVQPGEGKLVVVDGEKVAVHCDEAGQFSLLSPVCPHLGCLVRWNDAEQTWDCPCHGSRFDGKGQLINGPALTDLKPARAQAPATR